MKIAIYQVNPDRDENRVRFMNLQNTLKILNSEKVDTSIYDKVFEGDVECTDLERVYQMFNLSMPSSYTGRSMSVSDIVVVEEGEHTKPGCYFCDSFGFAEIDRDLNLRDPQV